MSTVGGVGSGSSVPEPVVDTPAEPATTEAYALRYAPFAADSDFAAVLEGRRTIGLGARGDFVKTIEETLVALGYTIHYRTRPDENLTAATRNAIARFQRDHGLEPTGVIDRATLIALDRAAAERLGGTTPAPEPSGPRPTDFVPRAVLERYGLSTTEMRTASEYEGQEWGDVGYYSYFGDVQYTAFAKHARVFGAEGAEDAHAYFEFYANPPGGLRRGSWIASGSIRESDFEATAGVDITGDRPIDNQAYKLLREAGAPKGARFALRDAEGKQIPVRDGDRLVPTVVKNGKAIEVDVDGEGNYRELGTGRAVGATDVVWRIRRGEQILYDRQHKVEDRNELLGVSRNVKFDFLDASGELVGYSPQRDRIVESWKEGERWHVLAKLEDGRFEHQVLEGDRVRSTEQVDAARAEQLKRGQDVIWRVQNKRTHALAGDGKVADTFDMGWWGKCHNVASLSTSNIPKPEQEVQVVTNLERGEQLALRWGDEVLVPRRGRDGAITGYEHQVRDAAGAVQSRRELSVEEGNALVERHRGVPVIVRADGSLKEAEVTRFDTESLTALVAHIGDGAVEYKGGAGERYYAHPDILVLKDGTQLQAHIKEIKTASGKTHTIGSRRGTEFYESDRSELRGPGMETRVLGGGGRRYNFNVQDMAKLNEFREDDITELTVIKPDGTEQTIKAEDVELFAWENKYDFRPDMIWELHKTITKDSSTVIETYEGTQVWNYSARSIETRIIDPQTLSARDRELAAKPGIMTGTVEPEGKVFFETDIVTDGGTERMRYWVRFDENGEIVDYAHLGDVPDFVWTQHVKKEGSWTGESQAPGVRNADIQRLYFASRGRLASHTLPGGVISADDLKRAPVGPEPR
ncbi:MAG: hypothetical protein KatS3mg102_0948 [Planctomycetota bacterium]|nr:MAG: hypothetical protein KatS3mg102_0948 [Planctomycetota bacterium]